MDTTSRNDAGPRILDPRLFLGTSSWSSQDWEGVFYPKGTPPGDYLSFYAKHFRTVEVDATFYRPPSPSMTKRWRQILPEGFLMAAKIPQLITHEKRLVNCQDDLKEFLSAMDHLEDRLGPLLLQFPYYSRAAGVTLEQFLERLRAFLPTLPAGYRFALEVRNKSWLKPELLDLLRGHGVALTLIDHPWMPRVEQLMADIDPVTADFCYVRWLGDRRGIEERTKSWDQIIIDRSSEMRVWVPAIRALLCRSVTVFGYFNNHYAGYAVGSIHRLQELWESA